MKTPLLFLGLFYFSTQMCLGQTYVQDSCGKDDIPTLNTHEIFFLDGVLFAPTFTKKQNPIYHKDSFDFKGKKLAFYSCTKNKNTKEGGFLTKKQFFDLFDSGWKGHAGKGIIVLNEQEKAKCKGYDAIVVIDCPHELNLKEQLLNSSW